MRNLPKQNLTHQLTHELGMAIVTGEYKVGMGLPSEAVLSEKYSVSRSATREAVKMLAAKGLISSRPKQGIVVQPEKSWNMFDTDVLSWILESQPSLALLKEFTQVRVALQPQATALAAVNASQEELLNIERSLQSLLAAESDLNAHLEAKIAFHTAIMMATGNRFFTQLIGFISTALRVSVHYTKPLNGAAPVDLQKHRNIYQAIKEGDAEGAERNVKLLLQQALERIEAQLQQA